jgi:GTPase
LIRRIQLSRGTPVLVSDTVGFIRKLPHLLVSAFRATLEEVVEADLILHVIDASDPEHEEKKKVVIGVLEEIGAGNHPRLTVYNKADLLDHPGDFVNPDPQALLVSAITGDNLESLVQVIINHLGEHARRGK